jgi:hypothetical protein
LSANYTTVFGRPARSGDLSGIGAKIRDGLKHCVDEAEEGRAASPPRKSVFETLSHSGSVVKDVDSNVPKVSEDRETGQAGIALRAVPVLSGRSVFERLSLSGSK